jgi:hypothetical protein
MSPRRRSRRRQVAWLCHPSRTSSLTPDEVTGGGVSPGGIPDGAVLYFGVETLHLWQQGSATATPFSSAGRMLACVTHLLRGGRVVDLASIDPEGSAATHYAFFDE